MSANAATVKSTTVIENILLSGYIREHEQNVHIKIPQLATSIISVYSKEYHSKVFGERLEYLNPTKLDKMDKTETLNTIQECCSDFNTFISNSHSTRNSLQSFRPSSDSIKQITPILLATNDQLIDTQSGLTHTLFLTEHGRVYALGTNDSGQLGLDENIKCVAVPTLIPLQQTIKQIACGGLHNLFLTKQGKLLVCGFNYCGQLGMKLDEISINGDASDYSETSVSEMSEESDCDSDSDSDSVSDWGDEVNNIVYKPVYNSYFEMRDIRFIDIGCGSHHSLCITTKGECFTFGHNGFGNLGNGEHGEYGEGIHEPYQLQLNVKFKSLSCGKNHNMLSTEDNEIIVFGDNSSKQCSNTEQEQFDSPFILSKEKEFGIAENCFIEKIFCQDYKSKVIIDVFKRAINIKS